MRLSSHYPASMKRQLDEAARAPSGAEVVGSR